MSNIIVFGGAGRTGREVVKQGLSAGHTITVFSYSQPADGVLPDHNNLTVVQGNAYTYTDVLQALPGHTVVINIIAPRLFDAKNYPISEIATNNIIKAMQECGIQRYIGQAGAWATDQYADASPFMQGGFKLFLPLKHVYAYKQKEDAIVCASNLDWTLVRCGLLTDKTPLSDYRIFRDRYKCSVFEIPKIRRVNVASFELSIIDDTTYFRQCPIIIE